ncbi:MAG: pyridoxal-phosphate dependent enzyme [Bacteroidota bacterium]
MDLLQKLNDPVIPPGYELWLLRLDRVHPCVGGNKWFKLKYNLEEARRQNKTSLLTLGGAFSNHIAAVAAAGKEQGFHTIGLIRGEAVLPLNKTLAFARSCGMELHFISRERFRQRDSEEFITELKSRFPFAYFIPMGGSNYEGFKGCVEIPSLISIPFDHICCPCGTGTTLAGLVLGLREGQQAKGFSAMKGGDFLEKDIAHSLQHYSGSSHGDRWQVETAYHFGGFGRKNAELLAFARRFRECNQVDLDYVYTSKMMFGIYDKLKKGHFPAGARIVAVHTGGLQGNPD